MRSVIIKRSTILYVSFGLLCYVLGSASAYAANYQYTAITEAPAANKQGPVRAGSLTWKCASNRCTISGPWPTPAVSSCKALADVVGRLRSYGHSGAQLNPSQMAQCNGSVTVKPMVQVAPPKQHIPAANGKFGKTIPSGSSSPNGGVRLGTSTASVPTVNAFVVETVAPAKIQGRLPFSSFQGANDWLCNHTNCTHAASVGQDLVYTCFVLARRVGRIKSFSAPGKSLNAQEIATCNGPLLHKLVISARSGEDDLRSGSKLLVDMIHQGRAAFDSPNVVFTHIPQHVRKSAEISNNVRGSMTANARLSLSGFERLKFTFKSGQGSITDGPDNWDMVELTVRAQLQDVDGGLREVTLIDGNHQHRFRPNDEWEVGVTHNIFGR